MELDAVGYDFDRAGLEGRVVHVHAAVSGDTTPALGFYGFASSWTPAWLTVKPVGDCEHAQAIAANSSLGNLRPFVVDEASR